MDTEDEIEESNASSPTASGVLPSPGFGVGDHVSPSSDEDDLVQAADSIQDISRQLEKDQDFSEDIGGHGLGSDSLEVVARECLVQHVEVCIPEMSANDREQYHTIESNVIEEILDEVVLETGLVLYTIMFADGRRDMMEHEDVLRHENGHVALIGFFERGSTSARKRKRQPNDEWDSEAGSSRSEPSDSQDEDELLEDIPRKRPATNRSVRSTRPQRVASQPTYFTTIPSDDDDDEQPEAQPTLSRRSLRPRTQTRRLNIADRDDRIDELGIYSSADEGEPGFSLVTSDITSGTKRPNRRRLQNRQTRLVKPRTATYRNSPASDIEFEAPRRSVRSTRHKASMRDDEMMDEESIIITEDRSPDIPKVISIKEVFQPTPPESQFASFHMDTCHSCGQSRHRGQLICCQGCSLSFHKLCIGYRSAREHQVTKVGDQNFVLQCKFCIGTYRKKDSNAPRYDMCQCCRTEGDSCASFSTKKTSRQEEKMREQNGGEDPITKVSPTLLNNTDNVLFRCAGCHRGWHVQHLPPAGGETAETVTDVRAERLKDYSIDWTCNDCSSARYKIQRLVAWRPTGDSQAALTSGSALLSSEIEEDNKEYLVKWDSTSYFHCSWKPGAWVFGRAAGVMRKVFAKRDAEQGLLKWSEAEAIPEEFLMPDVILHVKWDSSVSRAATKEEDLANVSKVRKILVKFQGLGYDDVVWDKPPPLAYTKPHEAYLAAIYEFLEGKHFHHESYRKIRERIRDFRDSEFEGVDSQPDGLMRGKLMGYQMEGLNWLLENFHHGRSVVLADEMGLGKTVQVISLVVSLIQDKPKCWPYLIVVPNATCPNWRREFKQWTPDLRVVTYHGGQAAQELAYKYELFPNGSTDMKAHVVIMSYDSAADPKTKTLFKGVHWAGLVVDEGQRLKNDQNLLYGALRDMKIPFRLLLTGTPLQNNKRELFNLLQFIDEKQNADELDQQFQVLDRETLPQLHEKIRPYFLRRTKAGVLKFLPPMAQVIVPVTMTVIQEKLSKSIMAKNPQLIKAVFANSKLKSTERGSLNNILMQLRKCLCHPFMYSEAIEERHHDPEVEQRNLVEASAKLILLQSMLRKLKAQGHRVLIFSQFLQQLDIIEDFLNGMGFGFRRLDGTMSSLEKQRRIDAFNAPDSELFAFLLSTRAGGVGINLATADTVIILDPDFNPHQDLQALSRAHRIGQKNKVLCIQLMTKDTVEERIMQIGRKKMALDHALIESMDDQDLAGDDLESILKHGAQALFDDDYQKQAIHYDDASVDKLLDRSGLTETKTDEDGGGETQYSYAKVWSNDRSAFEDELGAIEDQAPEPINSSVWDRILREREEEALKAADIEAEILGRGGRRRTAAGNYKPGKIEGLAEGIDGQQSDSSEEFASADSTDDSDDEEPDTAKGKRQKPSPTSQLKTPTSTSTKKQLKKAVNSNSQQSPKKKLSGSKTPTGKAQKGPGALATPPKTNGQRSKQTGKAAVTKASKAPKASKVPKAGKQSSQSKCQHPAAKLPAPKTPKTPKTSKKREAAPQQVPSPAPTPAAVSPPSPGVTSETLSNA